MSTETTPAEDRTETTRAALIDAAADLFAGEDRLPFWDETEYMRGICELIGNATGHGDNYKSDAWEAINARHQARELEAKADAIARQIADEDETARAAEEWAIPASNVRAMLRAAVLAGMEAAK
ncbi:hypothetical protein BKA24_001768 [Microbacterium marinum]|uniref:Uncharacterized protein n=1 Tax=Microbacterium marinum TaxID=421115 RepID=A0A7W7FL53_9MICO|nr:hypothetical protein [Microbacterium marinum]MBB4667059.1 hypothetical protein [Microbacterium marinum]